MVSLLHIVNFWGRLKLKISHNYHITDKLTSVIRSFSANWKRSIDGINGEIVKSFTNFKNGTNILQVRSRIWSYFLTIYIISVRIHTTCTVLPAILQDCTTWCFQVSIIPPFLRYPYYRLQRLSRPPRDGQRPCYHRGTQEVQTCLLIVSYSFNAYSIQIMCIVLLIYYYLPSITGRSNRLCRMHKPFLFSIF